MVATKYLSLRPYQLVRSFFMRLVTPLNLLGRLGGRNYDAETQICRYAEVQMRKLELR